MSGSSPQAKPPTLDPVPQNITRSRKRQHQQKTAGRPKNDFVPNLLIEYDGEVLKNLKKAFTSLNIVDIEWGYFPEQVYVDDERTGIPIATIGQIHELGLVSIGLPLNNPPRPFFTQSISRSKAKAKELAPVIYKNVLARGKYSRSDMLKAGKILAATVTEEILTGAFAPNSPTVQRKKGRNSPLIETGVLASSPTSKLVRKPAKKAEKT